MTRCVSFSWSVHDPLTLKIPPPFPLVSSLFFSSPPSQPQLFFSSSELTNTSPMSASNRGVIRTGSLASTPRLLTNPKISSPSQPAQGAASRFLAEKRKRMAEVPDSDVEITDEVPHPKKVSPSPGCAESSVRNSIGTHSLKRGIFLMVLA